MTPKSWPPPSEFERVYNCSTSNAHLSNIYVRNKSYDRIIIIIIIIITPDMKSRHFSWISELPVGVGVLRITMLP